MTRFLYTPYFVRAKQLLTAQTLASQSNQSQRSNSSLFASALKFLKKILIESPEPYIAEKRDRHGDPYFEAYDPLTETHCRFGEEQEARIWIEQRYHLKPPQLRD